jgi:MIP family channel proteins
VRGDYTRRGIAEFVGAFALTFVGVGATLTGAGGLVGVALAHGLVIAVMCSAVGHISGGHFNPAVTLGFLITRRMAPALAITYWFFQFVGAICAAALLWWIFPAQSIAGAKLGAPAVAHPFIGSGAGMVLEAILTFFLVWVIFATAADERGTFKSIAGLAIGLTITLGVLAGGPVTGAALNPSRALGPELIGWIADAGDVWRDAWIYYVGPFAGGAIAALAYQWLYLRPTRPAPVGPGTGLDEPRPGETALS